MADITFRAMGSRCRVVVDGGPPGLDRWARAEVERLERLWSRFLETSEISQLNRASGRPMIVSEPTYGLVQRAVLGWELSGGAFDPLLLNSLVDLGYDRSHEYLEPANGPTPAVGDPGATDWRTELAVELHDDLRMIRLPEGAAFDPGGIGKGYAADRIADALVAAGATWVMVSLGGDLALGGPSMEYYGWEVRVQDPFDPGSDVCSVPVRGGGVATSSQIRRRWTSDGLCRHHILDPRTGQPCASHLATVTVVAGRAWLAEVLAKSALIANDDEFLVDHADGMVCIGLDGSARTLGFANEEIRWLVDREVSV